MNFDSWVGGKLTRKTEIMPGTSFRSRDAGPPSFQMGGLGSKTSLFQTLQVFSVVQVIFIAGSRDNENVSIVWEMIFLCSNFSSAFATRDIKWQPRLQYHRCLSNRKIFYWNRDISPCSSHGFLHLPWILLVVLPVQNRCSFHQIVQVFLKQSTTFSAFKSILWGIILLFFLFLFFLIKDLWIRQQKFSNEAHPTESAIFFFVLPNLQSDALQLGGRGGCSFSLHLP